MFGGNSGRMRLELRISEAYDRGPVLDSHSLLNLHKGPKKETIDLIEVRRLQNFKTGMCLP